MKRTNIYLSLLSLMICGLLQACSNNDDPTYCGKDNFITEFSLSGHNGETYQGIIQGDEIRVSVPAQALQGSLTASYKVSPDATITPDPTKITEWEKSQTFVVSSKSGEKRTYSVSTTPIPTELKETVRLNTDEEVAAFAAKEISILEGNLIIGDPESESVVTSIASLSSLQGIKGSLVITEAYDGADIDLSMLKDLGSIVIKGTPLHLQKINLPSLKYLRQEISAKSDSLRSILMPNVEEVGNLKITGKHLEDLDLSHVSKAGTIELKTPFIKELNLEDLVYLSNFTVIGVNRQLLPEMEKSVLPGINMPQLKTVLGVFKVEKFPQLASINLPKLESIESIELLELPKLETLHLESLKAIYDKFNYSGYSVFNEAFENDVLKKLSFPELEVINGTFDTNLLKGLETIEMPKLKEITNLNVVSTVRELSVPSLEIIHDKLNLRFWKDGLLSNLKQVKALTFYDVEFDGLMDLSHLQIEELTLSECEKLGGVITPKELGLFLLQYDYYMDQNESGIVRLEGLEKCRTLNYKNVNFETAVLLPSTLKEVTENLEIGGKNLSSISSPALEVVGSLSANSAEVSFPALKKVTGKLDLTEDANTNFDFPLLTEVKNLAIGGRGQWSKNNTITNLNGLSNLETIGSISIQYCEKLVDYSGLKKAFDSGSITPKMWTDKNILGNAYNPTYEELEAGQWVMP